MFCFLFCWLWKFFPAVWEELLSDIKLLSWLNPLKFHVLDSLFFLQIRCLVQRLWQPFYVTFLEKLDLDTIEKLFKLKYYAAAQHSRCTEKHLNWCSYLPCCSFAAPYAPLKVSPSICSGVSIDFSSFSLCISISNCFIVLTLLSIVIIDINMEIGHSRHSLFAANWKGRLVMVNRYCGVIFVDLRQRFVWKIMNVYVFIRALCSESINISNYKYCDKYVSPVKV